jgi:hypothetical protein
VQLQRWGLLDAVPLHQSKLTWRIVHGPPVTHMDLCLA